MVLFVGLVLLTQAVSYRETCWPQAFPPWLPHTMGFHNTIEPVALGNGYVLCCDGKWGVAPLQTGYIKYVCPTRMLSLVSSILNKKK